MIKRICFIITCIVMILEGNAQVTLFDSGWKFFRGGAQRAEMSDYDDSKWRNVDLPHDWSIEDLPGTNSPFDPTAVGQVSTGFTVGGSGWYRKTFVIPADQKGKRIHIQFDGVYMNTEYWLNGESIGKHPYGYTSCWFDITDKVKAGESNVLAVQVKNEGQNSRWYSGSGIYRHVWLKVLDPIHVAPWGTYITTPEVSESRAKVVIRTEVENMAATAADLRVVTRILKDKSEISKAEARVTLNAGSPGEAEQVAIVERPMLWSTETPNLYTAVTEVYQGDRLTNRKEEKFGIRSILFDAVKGFQLNGKPLKLKGGCIHHDNGPLGAKAYDRAEERRVELLKAAGFNAIRSSHNPPSPAFLDACDRLGMLVIDEAFDMWRIQNNPHDYHLFFDEWWQHDIESMVKRDRNHPSIIMWSIGNEIREMESAPVMAVAKMLGDHIRKMEPTRPVTAAVNNLRPQKDPFFANLDVCGYNYAAGGDHLQESLYAQDHKRLSDRVMFGSESYPLEAFGAWQGVEENPYVIGDFVWTAFDYIGEASIGWRGYWQESSFYPWNLAYCGDIDICGWRRPQSYYREALWRENTLGLFVKPPVPTFPLNPNKQSWSKWEWHDVLPDWNWKGYEGQPLEVSVYSSFDQAELFLNGKSLGKKATGKANKYEAKWQVRYSSGELKAVGYRGKKDVATSVLRTAAEPVALKLLADRPVINADGQDLSYVTVELVDEKGNKDPKADNLVKFEIEGNGTIVAVGNANPMSIESYQQHQRTAWQGRCLVIVKSDVKAGTIKLRAVSAGLKTGEITIESK
ncbi:glycoside hydrolase family 2 TIM barrel-domain containing protein [Flavihumibacter solisilvae]|nr:glycoside hydrolase family 2 TIM barrel-domain containing protein [Flavihumibacter solisilvae]